MILEQLLIASSSIELNIKTTDILVGDVECGSDLMRQGFGDEQFMIAAGTDGAQQIWVG